MRRFITRREALGWLGSLVAVGCASGSESPVASTPAPTQQKPTPPAPTASGSGKPPDPVDAGPPPVDAADAALPQTPEELLAGIESVVVLMMENRSFDHFLGSLKTDMSYSANATVEGLAGTESNPAPDETPVPVFKMTNFTPEDPPHHWDECHAQWNQGKNDGFVKAHAGASQNEVMGFHDRSQIPFYYWLADNFTVCDHWFASVMGPTWPNRYFLHACTSGGKKGNTEPFWANAPPTVWRHLKQAGKTFKNYTASVVGWYTGAFVGELQTLNPVRQISEFFDDAQQGTLPNFSIIDPDFTSADDHPSHDIKKGQVFAASIYRAIAESPQWSKTLLIITYDEHGGFFDHVAPPKTFDQIPDFEQLGFRVPAFVIGARVKKGHVEKTVLEHCSVAATLKTLYGIQSLNPRMDAASTIAGCIDPKLVNNPASPPINMPVPSLSIAPPSSSNRPGDRVGFTSQPDLDAVIERGLATGAIHPSLVDPRSAEVRMMDWLSRAEKVGAVKLQQR